VGATSSLSKEPRLITAQAGSELGFIPNTSLSFKSKTKKKKNRDYHGETNFDNFLW
jgi:hypothetical protein